MHENFEDYDPFRGEGDEDDATALDPMLVAQLNARFEQALHRPLPATPRSMTAIEREAALAELQARAKETKARATKTIDITPISEGGNDHEQSE